MPREVEEVLRWETYFASFLPLVTSFSSFVTTRQGWVWGRSSSRLPLAGTHDIYEETRGVSRATSEISPTAWGVLIHENVPPLSFGAHFQSKLYTHSILLIFPAQNFHHSDLPWSPGKVVLAEIQSRNGRWVGCECNCGSKSVNDSCCANNLAHQ